MLVNPNWLINGIDFNIFYAYFHRMWQLDLSIELIAKWLTFLAAFSAFLAFWDLINDCFSFAVCPSWPISFSRFIFCCSNYKHMINVTKVHIMFHNFIRIIYYKSFYFCENQNCKILHCKNKIILQQFLFFKVIIRGVDSRSTILNADNYLTFIYKLFFGLNIYIYWGFQNSNWMLTKMISSVGKCREW